MTRTGATRTGAVNAGSEAEMAARAAWLHFVGGLTQSEVAKRLNVPNTRAHRYIARAQSEGLVRVFVDIESADCVALETQLMAAYGLSVCRVAMEAPESGPLPLRALSAIGGDYLMQTVAAGAHEVIGVGHGRTIAASVDAMGRTPGENIRFVSMLGGLTRSYAANPYDVIHNLARKTKAEAYLMPAPLFANSAEDKQVMMGQSGLAATMDLIAKASLVVVGIGDMDSSGGGASADALDGPDAIAELSRLGAAAEILGQFLTAEGTILATPYDRRVMAPALESLRGREVVAIAGGESKVDAIRAALRSEMLTGLIIDEATARRLVEAL
ncbi:sugar-binding transcriptional regulator [Pelagibius litoralis]|uniref:sugar-binding transcriptional regulator n=1 Tax=Pelagibius litoralis TaxID=374515 RepID=UPI00197EFA27|nr:sugar-binding transcriptional regulator [Pelagibius litoralis]